MNMHPCPGKNTPNNSRAWNQWLVIWEIIYVPNPSDQVRPSQGFMLGWLITNSLCLHWLSVWFMDWGIFTVTRVKHYFPENYIDARGGCTITIQDIKEVDLESCPLVTYVHHESLYYGFVTLFSFSRRDRIRLRYISAFTKHMFARS